MLVEFPVEISEPDETTSRKVATVTPPALKEFDPEGVTSDAKSTSARRKPLVEEFAMLSEITASRVALTDSPATPAFSAEERLIDTPHMNILNLHFGISILIAS